MSARPKWFVPVVVLALLWNLLGCLAYLADVSLSADDISKLPEAQQAMYAARPAWSVGATAVAVWGGALGCLLLLLRQPAAQWLLMASLLGVIVQDISIFGLLDMDPAMFTVAAVLQSLVLVIAVLLVLLARKAARQGWLARSA